MMACSRWMERDFLARAGRDPGPPCGHDPTLCPPIADLTPPEPSEREKS